MKNFFSRFFKEMFSGVITNVIVILLFVFFYFTIPDYWFLCSLFTVIVYVCIDIYAYHKKKGGDK